MSNVIDKLPSLALALCLGWPGAGAAAAPEGTRDAMQTIFANLSTLVAGIAEERVQSTSLAWESLRSIGEQAALLTAHSRADDPLTIFLGGSLERMAQVVAAVQAYEEGPRWQSVLFQMTDVCVACHTRSAAPDSPAASAFVARSEVAALPLAVQAGLATAMRRFRRGAESWDRLTRERVAALEPGSTSETSMLSVTEPLAQLLVLSLRVMEDTEPVESLLDWMGGQPRLPPPLVSSVRVWSEALRTVVPAPPPVEALLDAADRLDRESPAGGLVHRVTASSVLYRELDTPGRSPEEQARSYYRLGLVEHALNRDHWLPRTELFLEAAILAAPGSSSASAAHALLRRIVERTFAARGGPPDEVREHLEMLQRKISEAGGPAG